VAVAASLMSVSVGVRNLPRIAEPLARMLQARVEQRGLDDAAVDIVVLENQLGAAEVLRDAVLCRRRAYPEAARLVEARRVGFVGTVVGRMIPVVPDERLAEDPLLVRVEPFCTLPVERPAFTTGVPDIPGFEPVDNIDAYEERKLFTHNCSHSSAAYLGYLAGHTFVWQVMRDPALRDKVEGIMREIGAGLIARHRFDPQALREHEDDLLHRFANRALGDTVARVGGDPVRKLGPHDRMIGGARCALDGGGDAQGVCEAIAAALKFNPPGDPSAPQIRKHLEQGGPEAVWRNVCGLSPDDPLWDRLMAAAEA
jgi:mannitol-1-phosphate 5-dehydrogenase